MSQRRAVSERLSAAERRDAVGRREARVARWLVPVADAPDTTRTLHIIGDVHMGAIKERRLDTLRNDLRDPTLPQPSWRIQIGDLIDSGRTPDVVAQTWMKSLSPSVTYDYVIGNHEFLSGYGPAFRSAAEWARAYGYGGSQNYSRDVGFAKLIVLGPDTYNSYSPITLTRATLAFLEAELGATTKDCLVFCHAPLDQTVIKDPRIPSRTSTNPFWHSTPSAEIRSILALHDNAKAWISGHTHSPLTAAQLVYREWLGNHYFLHLNTMSPYYVGELPPDSRDPIFTVYLTCLAGRFEIRFRNHGAAGWGVLNGQQVTEVTLQ